jgi:hypothetical protein
MDTFCLWSRLTWVSSGEFNFQKRLFSQGNALQRLVGDAALDARRRIVQAVIAVVCAVFADGLENVLACSFRRPYIASRTYGAFVFGRTGVNDQH